MKGIILGAAGFLALATLAFSAPSKRLIDAIHKVESGRSTKPGIVGDNGKAIGPFQIHLSCWRDAVEFDRSIGGSYSDCDGYDYSKRIVVAYLTRYGKGKSEVELARIWNGGPKGHLKSATAGYGAKVARILGIK